MKKHLKWVLRRMTRTESCVRMAAATGIGVFLGMLPLAGIRLPIVILLSALGSLNIVALGVGLAATVMIPAVHMLTAFLSQKIGQYSVPFFTLRYLSVSNLLRWTHIDRLNALSSLISGLVWGIVAFGLFYGIYRLVFSRKDSAQGAHFIFHDVERKRWPLFRVVVLLVACILIACLSVAIESITVNPVLPDLRLEFVKQLTDINPLTSHMDINTFPARLQNFYTREKKKQTKPGKKTIPRGSRKTYAFYVSWDENSLKSLRAHVSDLNCVIPNWFVLGADGSIQCTADAEVDALLRDRSVANMPLINNYANDAFDPACIHRLVNSNARETVFSTQIIAQLKSGGYCGLNIDFENIADADRTKYTNFLKKLYVQFQKSNLTLTVDVGAMDDAAYIRRIAAACDHVIVMLYDEHDQNDTPGSIASAAWVTQAVDALGLPAGKAILSFGSYGYDWVSGGDDQADVLSYDDLMDIYGANHLHVVWDPASGNPYILYSENGDDHIVWFLDAATFYDEVNATSESGAEGVALWRLGSEDPGVWPILRNMNKPASTSGDDLETIKTIRSGSQIDYTGTGEILYVSSQGHDGTRAFTTDASGRITDETYTSFPTGYSIQRMDRANGKVVALTFDDGPDSYYTPRILNVLERHKVKATFFVIGENAAINPDILTRIYRDGDDIGNHTFTHPNIARISFQQTCRELNLTQRLIQEITGHSTILFRAPYEADAEPDTLKEIVPVERAQKLGYIMVGERIDPLDWQSPKPDVIEQRVLDGLKNGNIVLLHDGGGNRSNTLQALPALIDTLQKQGYQFDTVSQLMGRPRNQVMPPVQASDHRFIFYDHGFFNVAYNLNRFLIILFYLTLFLGTGRLLFLIVFSYLQKRRSKKSAENLEQPFVSVVVPAYNEETVIVRTVHSILEGSYRRLEVIVVDDGSKDGTCRAVSEAFAGDSSVRILRKVNGGKPAALNLGILESHGSIIVAIDADTILDQNAISQLVRGFSDPSVAAVSGNVKVGNRKNWLTQWQHNEYVTGFNLERRAYSLLNCITVVPGAIGAWRRDALLDACLFREDTMAEDTDMTLLLLRRGWKICYANKALAYTETPETLRAVLKQRSRWTYGTLQCLWKHKRALLNPQHPLLGFLALPCMWIFQFLFQALSPLVDLCMLLSLLTAQTNLAMLTSAYLLFFAIDAVACCYAFVLDRESFLPLLWLPIQRIAYRLLMAYVVLKSLLTGLRGKRMGWNKLKRTGHVA